MLSCFSSFFYGEQKIISYPRFRQEKIEAFDCIKEKDREKITQESEFRKSHEEVEGKVIFRKKTAYFQKSEAEKTEKTGSKHSS